MQGRHKMRRCEIIFVYGYGFNVCKSKCVCKEAVISILSVAFYSSIRGKKNLQYRDYKCVFKDDDSKIFIIKINMDMLYS